MARYPLTLFTPGGLTSAGPGDPFLALHREMNRLFDDVLRGGSVPAAGQGQGGSLLAPHMDVTETDKEVRLQAELPGDTQVRGRAVGVDAGGNLIIDTGTGREVVSAGDVTHLRPSR